MKLSRNVKHLLAVLTFINLLAGIVGLIWFFSTLLPIILTGNEEVLRNMFIISAPLLFTGIIVLGVLSTALLVFYLVHAAMNKRLSTAMKIVWVLILLFLKPVAQIVYLFVEIYPAEKHLENTTNTQTVLM